MRHPHWYAKLLLALPLCLGMYGLAGLAGQPFWDSLFLSVTMYALNYTDSPPNLFVELARWTAPLATAGGTVMAFRFLRRWAGAFCKRLRGGSVAVYGPEPERRLFLAQLDGRGIDGGDDGRFYAASRYVLLGSETENFAFYQTYARRLKGRPVYLQCASLPQQSVPGTELTLFCPEELAARLYWRERELFSLWERAGSGPVRIVFLGFGRLGEQLLMQGLQNNIFDPQQRLEYHIFGDCAPFLATHPGLADVTDLVIGHSESWYEALPLIEQAELVLVLTQQEQTALTRSLLDVTHRAETDVFSAGEPALELLEQTARLRIFPWRQKAMEPELLFGDVMYRRAKHIHLRYCHLYGGTPETEEDLQREWAKLDAFTRGSNISAADYHEMRLRMMEAKGLPADAGALSQEELERLAELEHIRWCRYHLLNNWQYGTPDNGKNKDAVRRIHTLLVPYAALPEAEKEKDRENIRVMLDIL